MEASLIFHSSDHNLTLGRVICPSSVTFTALGSDIKITFLLGRVWGQEEPWDVWGLEGDAELGTQELPARSQELERAGKEMITPETAGISVALSQLCHVPLQGCRVSSGLHQEFPALGLFPAVPL